MDLSVLNDYMKDGVVEQGRQVHSILVNSESDLTTLGPYGYEPGCIAHTAGYTQMWQLDTDGEWVEINISGGGSGSLNIHICTVDEYDAVTGVPTIEDPDANTIYLVPGTSALSPDLYVEWVYVNDAWEQFGSARIDLSDYVRNGAIAPVEASSTSSAAYAIGEHFWYNNTLYKATSAISIGGTITPGTNCTVAVLGDEVSAMVQDVQVNGTSVVTAGVADVPIATSNSVGVVMPKDGLFVGSSGNVTTNKATSAQIKKGEQQYSPIVSYNQHESAFYGLAKAAGDTTQKDSANAVGTYTDNAKSAIRQMIGSEDALTKSYNVLLDTTITTVDDGVHANPYATVSNLSLNLQYKYRVTFDGVASELNAGSWYAITTGLNHKGYEFLGNISLYDSTVPDVIHNDSTMAYCILYLSTDFEGLQFFTTTAGNHTVKIERIAYSKSQYPDTLVYGNEEAPIRRHYNNSSYESVELGSNATPARGAFAIGFFNTVTSEFGTAIGMRNKVSAGNAVAIGVFNEATGLYAVAEGTDNTASGPSSHTEGSENTASGNFSHAEGHACTASGLDAHAEGGGNTASGDHSHAEGFRTQAKKSYAHAEGADSIANANCSHVEGYKTEANAMCAHAEGRETIAMGAGSHTDGYYNVADSYADWNEWVANTHYVVGDKAKRTTTSNGTTTVTGYICKTPNSDSSFTSSNWTVDTKMNYAVITGNGTAANDRSNAYALDWDGNGHYAGDVYVGCNTDSTGGTKLARIPGPSTGDGTYELQASVSSGVTTYTWAPPGIVEEVVSGTTVTISAQAGKRYLCGEVSTISFTPSQSGICEVIFTSGSSAAILTLPNTVKMPDWFDPTSLDTNTVYEISIADGVYGAVMTWAA